MSRPPHPPSGQPPYEGVPRYGQPQYGPPSGQAGAPTGDSEACDHLYRQSPPRSAHELYGGTCAGRQPNADGSEVFCVDAFPPAS